MVHQTQNVCAAQATTVESLSYLPAMLFVMCWHSVQGNFSLAFTDTISHNPQKKKKMLAAISGFLV